MKNLRKEIFLKLKNVGLVSGEALASSLGVSRADVNKHIKKLREMGCVISAARKSGYILESVPQSLTFGNLEIALADKIPNLRLVNLAKTDSTQLRIKALAEKGAAEWLVVRADKQTAGYGRLRRAWTSPEGGLWFSVLLTASLEPAAAPAFSPAFSLAVRSAVEAVSGVKCFLKWPNDVLVAAPSVKNPLIAGGFKKIAGIITEISADTQRVHWLAVGCGINVSNRLPSATPFPASSLKKAGARRRTNPAEILAAVLSSVKDVYDAYVMRGFKQFAREYDSYNILTGREVSVESFDGIAHGAAQGVDEHGRLVLRTAEGIRNVIAGDVTIKQIR
ncbi:MAG: biotin--[acetyl-CoA-carboxylase] ligase [Endomicrobiia bacterium]|nr:biotin--[acetyl-CoA-carboxylase] ligase [Endomicrobiia bacterium]